MTQPQNMESTVVLDEVMDISVAGQWRENLLKILQSERSIVLDASRVVRIDTAGLQVLTAFVKDAAASNKSMRWQSPTEGFCQAAALLGLSKALQLTV